MKPVAVAALAVGGLMVGGLALAHMSGVTIPFGVIKGAPKKALGDVVLVYVMPTPGTYTVQTANGLDATVTVDTSGLTLAGVVVAGDSVNGYTVQMNQSMPTALPWKLGDNISVPPTAIAG